MTTNREAAQDWIREFVKLVAKGNAHPDDVEDLYTILDLAVFIQNTDSVAAKDGAERRQRIVLDRLKRLAR